MGNDGGSIPKRHELVRTKGKESSSVDKNEALAAKWQCCTLSKEPLQRPVVACELGNMYNKEELLQHILKGRSNPAVAHIRRLKDVVELKLTPNPSFSAGRLKDGSVAADAAVTSEAQFMCPLTLVPMNGHHRFSYLRSCGCVFADKALRELKGNACVSCNTPFTEADVIPLYPDSAELEILRTRMEERRAKAGRAAREAKRTAADKPDDEQAAKKPKGEAVASPALVPEAVRRALTGGASSSSSSSSETTRSEVLKSLFHDPSKPAPPAKGVSPLFQGTNRAY